ncbi:MAG TPA: cation diffusion facilitator family transporter [Candidatus Paceibacterota bacterium]|nr:cation diffusion facilitator family transporter [Candidatus Pacearchaeota archaeon]HRZ50605.1 cation diffusion facilitator family transporter [Candidatus Paceibacterota bacterium]HSA36498.1 cation diffusion facilitator family transporter [Candidatus Paceibacterota bacterium]
MKEKIAVISIAINTVLAAGKIAAGFLANSSSVVAEGVHSFVDIFSSAIGYLGIKISQKPVDQKHPYGYYKFEVLAGGTITLLLLGTGAGIAYEAFQGLFLSKTIELGYLPLGIMIISATANEIMARLKIHYGKRENSVALISDGIHSRADVFASLAVLCGLVLAVYWSAADSVLALLIGFYIIKESFSLGKEVVDSLLDVSAGEEVENKIKSIAKTRDIEINSLKTQKKGFVATADLAIALPKNLKIEEAEKISDDLRKALMAEINNLRYVSIQISSHEVESVYYKPEFGKGFGWRQKGKFKNKIQGAEGKGPGGDCVCPQCGHKIQHERGTPCSKLKCPDCKITLERK